MKNANTTKDIVKVLHNRRNMMNPLELVTMEQNTLSDWWIWALLIIFIIITVAISEYDYEE